MAWRGVLALLLLAGICLPAPSVRAQGFFEQFLGGAQLPRPPPRPFIDRQAPIQSYGDAGGGGTYRTLCVRLCDGYYFPISFSTTRSNFSHDADQCAASCGGEARLFYHPNPGGDVDTMVDLTGMGYAQLRTAFKYRKALVKGCTCRPQPWSEAELGRHRAYVGEQQQAAVRQEAAADEDTSRPQTSAVQERPQVTTASEPQAVVRPEPVSRYALPSVPHTRVDGNSPWSNTRTKRGSPGSFFR